MKRVLVSGVFNVLHPGHIRLLRFAKECGDRLTVAVQSDQTSNQPIHVADNLRLEGVLSNTYVDEAFITDESVESLVQRLKPDVLVKGREHEGKENPEEILLKAYGGELLFDSGEISFSSLDLLQKELQQSTGCTHQLPQSYMERHKITASKLIEHISAFPSLRIAVVGDLIMDEYITCDPLGMSQEDPTIVVTPVDNQLFVGGAGIVSAHAAGLGARVNFISVTGSDPMQEQAQTMLREMGVDVCLIADHHRPTTLKQRYRSRGKTLLRVSHLHQSDISQKLQDQLLQQLEAVISDIDLLVFSDFNYGCLPDNVVEKMTRLAKKYQICTVADSQSSSQIGDVSRYKHMDLLTPTEREARIAMRDHSSGLVVLAEKLRQSTATIDILLKLGEEGVLIHASGDGDPEFVTDRIVALNTSPKDVAGAGDSMLITAAMMLRAGGSIWEAALLGSIAASLQVGRLGNQPLQLQELLESING
ncbi:MAG: adenylyltransferase/cytidyltransferase family protein [Candidatus Marinimicrobia bacterium]|jgi:rfaE bifunctional protein kinase chain/domain|nr:adenylyltransferase/cytidyltransferase family protein [Gammaproteobacteria bacterium]MBT4605569.1 adenylyltransferase/cytidyltransferase family protein [Thiotrichales bacterium]MBT4948051.1 adenylyltransferase/cytidyltransferase family protein [Candidatus Neomarinimicrobiota bacterium]MBT5371330.1 adenylyltransferase/cytidyltransferase family protein [Gammaproteobacteria bacterium]MBT6217719.1 adenylyltransferase/cytidyltransferase family protein [Candidatus Neomarinimicrobiota bacterium]